MYRYLSDPDFVPKIRSFNMKNFSSYAVPFFESKFMIDNTGRNFYPVCHYYLF
jgi:hypothetical protein